MSAFGARSVRVLRKASGVWGFGVCAVARPAAPPRCDPRGLGRRRGRLRGAAVAFLCTPSLTVRRHGARILRSRRRGARGRRSGAPGAARMPRCAPRGRARRPSAQKATKCGLSRRACFTRARGAQALRAAVIGRGCVSGELREVATLAVRRAVLLSRFQFALRRHLYW